MDAIGMLFTSLAFVISKAAGVEDFTYNTDTTLTGKLPSDGSPLSTRSMLECANVCTPDTDCQGFYFSRTLRTCFLDKGTFTQFQVTLSAEYFIKIGGTTTSTTTTTTTTATTTTTTTAGPTNPITQTTSTSTQTTSTSIREGSVSISSCPQTFQSDILLLGHSGNYYDLTILPVNVTQSEADTRCTQRGLQLVKVNDDTKIWDLRRFFKECVVYNDGIRYWTDAVKQISEPGQPWRHSDGSEASFDNVWCDGPADGADSQACLMFKRMCTFKLNDNSCDEWAWVVCE